MKAPARTILLICLVCAAALAAAGQRDDDAVISKFIASQESYENGHEAKDYRTVLRGDLNHDGVPDAAVLYTLEGANGTNNYVRHLAVFLRTNGTLVPTAHAVVGGKNYRAIVMKAIQDNAILCDTTDYASNDPTCCPTIKGSTRYLLDGDKLKELPAK